MVETIFRNESGVELSDSLRARIAVETRGMADRLLAEGHGPELLKESVVVLLLPDDEPASHIVVPKPSLRDFVGTVEKAFKDQTHRPAAIKESLIQRCLGELPENALRILFVSTEMCGSLQLHLKGEYKAEDQLYPQAAGTGARLRLHGREPLLKRMSLNPSAYEALTDRMGMKEEPLGDIADQLYAAVEHLPKDQAMRVLEDAELSIKPELVEIRESRSDSKAEQHNMARVFLEKLPNFRERWKSVVARSRKVVIPPDVKSANNVEVMLMAAAYVFDPVTCNMGLPIEEISFLIGHFSHGDAVITRLLQRMDAGFRGMPYSRELQDFGVEWMRSGFPKLEVGHKLAASLAMTDVPEDIEVLAPWKAWSLIVPTGLFEVEGVDKEAYARIWCWGSEPKFFVLNTGELLGPLTRADCQRMFVKNEPDKTVTVLWGLVDSLIRGACLALSNPEEYKRQPLKEKAASGKKSQRDGEPDFAVNRFMLSAPVEIDLRDHIKVLLSGKKKHGGGAPTVQFFVRGHWRQQAHGPGRSLRKTIRIEGFWKGPEHGAIKLGNYKVKNEGES